MAAPLRCPFQVRSIVGGLLLTVEMVTDSSAGRFYWIRDLFGNIAPYHEMYFTRA